MKLEKQVLNITNIVEGIPEENAHWLATKQNVDLIVGYINRRISGIPLCEEHAVLGAVEAALKKIESLEVAAS